MAEKKENGLKNGFRIFATVIKVICVIFLILLIICLAFQRFSNNEVAIGGFRMFTVATGSMVPTYNVGDVILVKSVDTDSLNVGDVVTYIGSSRRFFR